MSTAQAQARVRELIAREPVAAQARSGTAGWLLRLCRAASKSLPASGAGISLMTEHGNQGTAAASDPTSEVIEELQLTLGEGPCVDAFATRRPVLAPDLGDAATRRWPGYSAAAHARGVRAVFAFPLQVGASRLGVLDVYRARPGDLAPAALSEALTFADVAVLALLDEQERGSPPHGPDAGAEFDGATAGTDGLDGVLGNRFELYQAQGMVMAQLGVPMSDAVARLRAYAYAHDRPLGDVAHDIVARVITLEQDPRASGPTDPHAPTRRGGR